MPAETEKEILKTGPSSHLSHRHVGTIKSRAQARNQLAAGKRIWVIAGVFIVAIALIIAGFVFYARQQNERMQAANQYKSQPLAEEARMSLMEDTAMPADYLIIPDSSGTVAVSASGPLVLDVSGNLSCPSCVTGVVPSATTLVEQITNNYTTVEAITNNYSSLEQITNNYVTNVYDTLSLSAGTGIAISEVNGKYTISTSGVANQSLSNLSNVAINTHLLPAVHNSTDVGSGVAAFRSGYYGTSVHTPTMDTLLAGQLTIGMSTATSVLLGADTIMTAGKSLTVNGAALFKNAANSTAAFQIQNSAGIALLNANTTQGTLSVGTYVPTTVWSTAPAITATYTTDSSPQSVASTDFNGDNKADVAVVNANSNTLSVFMNTGTGTLAAKVNYTTGSSPTGVTSADLNGDGKADLIVANRNSNTVSVFMNTGTGTFAAKVDYAAGLGPVSVSSADLNNDSKLDVIVANSNSNTVSVFMNTGTGTFAAKVDYATGALPYSVVAADLNGDSKSDLATANASSNTVSVFMNTGTGTFAAKVDYITGNGSQSVVAADLNGDSKSDLATANASSNTVSVFMNTGTGTFAAKVDYSTGAAPTAVTSGDFNNDNKLDLVAANNSSSSISVLNNNGDSTFATKVDYATSTSPYSVTNADFNSDGKADLAVTHLGGSLSVIQLNSTPIGTTMTQFASKFAVNATPNTIGQLIQGTAGQTADLLQARDDLNNTLLSVGANGDTMMAGTLKVTKAITASSTLTVAGAVVASSAMNVAGTFTSTGSDALFKNASDSTTAFQIQQASGATIFGVDTTNGRISVGTSAPANKLSVNTLTTVDTTAQVAISTSAAGNKGLVIQGVVSQTANLFESQSSTGAVMASIGATGTTLFKNTVNSTSAFQIQDSAGAALLNANTSQGTLSVGTYVPTVVWSTAPVTKTDYIAGANPQGVTKADVNGDGKADLITSNISSDTVSVFINNGNGTFTAKVDYATGLNPRGITSADFNGDGKPDLAVGNWGANTISILMNTGTGTFAAKVDYATGSRPQNPTSADFNGDGKADVAVAYADTNAVSVFMNTGTGTFAAKVDYVTGIVGTTSWAVTSADFNGDGKADLAVTNSSSNTVSVFMNTGTGTFAAKVDYATGSTAYGVAAADFNGDAKVDLVVTNANGNTVSVFMNTGTGTFAAKVDYATGGSPQSVIASDLNNDTKADLAVANQTSNTVSVFLGNGNGTFASKVDYVTGSGPTAITNADFNGDGTIDLATANNSGSNMSVLLFGITTGTPVAQVTSKLVVNSGANAVGQIIQGTAGQAADLLQVRDDLNKTLFSIGSTGNVTAASALNVVGTFTGTGDVLFKNAVNSTTAFQVQQANGTNVFSVDTTSGRVAIGTASLGNNKLSVNALATGDNSAQVAISTGMNNNKGLIVQGVSGQFVDLLQAQSSTGAVLASIGATGALTVTSATISGNITINGHIVTGGAIPSIVAGAAACTAPTVSVIGNDTSGTVTVTAGTGCLVTGSMATITFNTAFGSAPRIILSASNASAANLKLYNGSVTTTAFTLDTGTIPTDTTAYRITYWVVR